MDDNKDEEELQNQQAAIMNQVKEGIGSFFS